MKTFKLHLIRHGFTQENLDGIYMGGGLDRPLCEAGRAQLVEMKSRFAYPNVGVVFTSPMLRAVQTADILFPEVKNRHELEDLRENKFGEYEGRHISELMQEDGFKKWLDPESDFTPAGGESGKAFNARCAKVLMGMMEFLIKSDTTEAACVTHGGVIMSMLGQKALPQRPPLEWMADNGAGYLVQTSASMFMRDGKVEALAITPAGYESYLEEQQPATEK